MKRIISFVMAFVMVLSLVPAVSAAGGDLTAAVGVNGLTVTAGDTESVDHPGQAGNGTVDWSAANGNITAVAIPVGETEEQEQVCATLTFRNDLGYPATLRFKYNFAHEEPEWEDEEFLAKVVGLDGDSGDFERELGIDEFCTITVISTVVAEYGPATLTISGISLSTGGDVTATFTPADNGSYTVNGESITADTEKTAAVGTPYAVSATTASGYQFFGWHDGTKYLSYKAEDNLTVNENCTISPVFIKDTVAVFGVGIARFQSLTDADAYAASGAVKTIVLMNDGILTGEHTISAGNTLLIPYDAANTVHTAATSTAKQLSESTWENVDWEQPESYRTLTMAADAKITVNGSLNVGGRHSAGPFLTAGSPSGDLGMIQMAEGSNITVNNGGTLYCWGYIYGDGTVTVKNGGAAHENFQFSDFRGGNATLALAQDFLVFPLSQYYVQNIEVEATFEYGATEYVWGSIYLTGKMLGTNVKFIGNDKLSMFIPGETGSVIKTYDPATDRLIIDVNGGGSINPMGLELGGQPIDTRTFVLPINSNMTININSGVTSLSQSLALLPGAKLVIDEGATLSLKSGEPAQKSDGSFKYAGGYNLIVYDRDQWLKAYKPIFNNGYLVGAENVNTYFVYTNKGVKRLQPVAWTPTRTGNRTEADLVDAVVDINGKLITGGFVYTTVDIDVVDYFYYNKLTITGGGAAVTSSKGTGELILNNGAGSDFITLQAAQNSTETEDIYVPMVPARLQNADGSYVDTYTAAHGAVFSYCANCEWIAGSKATHTVEVTWIVDGKDETQEFCKGTKLVYGDGTDPVKDGYEFIGWSLTENGPVLATLPVATEDAVYFAVFQQKATGLLGDLNLDRIIDADDLTIIACHVGGIEELTDPVKLANADLDGNGLIDSEDLTIHACYVGGIISDWKDYTKEVE